MNHVAAVARPASKLPGAVHARITAAGFVLRDGDRVTFYGDSITEQREYTEDFDLQLTAPSTPSR
jgi:hypothetical protein